MRDFPSSSAIEGADYRANERTLDIWYRGGDRYRYFNIPEAIYEGLCSAPSAGEFVNTHIKPLYLFEIETRRRRFRPD